MGAIFAGLGVDEAYLAPILSLPYLVDHAALMMRLHGSHTAAQTVITVICCFALYVTARLYNSYLSDCLLVMQLVPYVEKLTIVVVFWFSFSRVNGHFDEFSTSVWQDLHHHDQLQIALVENTISPMARWCIGATMAVLGFNTAKWLFH